MKEAYESIFEDILCIILDNLKLSYQFNDDSFKKMKEYCNKNKDNPYRPLEYHELMTLIEEVKYELSSLSYLYDFRDFDER